MNNLKKRIVFILVIFIIIVNYFPADTRSWIPNTGLSDTYNNGIVMSDRNISNTYNPDTMFALPNMGDADIVVGVYVEDVLALPVIQQPKDNNSFVSDKHGVVTQFSTAAEYGTVGILAHNYLAGKYFYNIDIGKTAIVIYGDGTIEYFIVREIREYIALDPKNIRSDFIDLSDTNRTIITSSKLFEIIYSTDNRLVFQTCIRNGLHYSWGRLFVIAEKVKATTNTITKMELLF